MYSTGRMIRTSSGDRISSRSAADIDAYAAALADVLREAA